MKQKGQISVTVLEWQDKWVTTQRPLWMWTKRGLFRGSSHLTFAHYTAQSILRCFVSLTAKEQLVNAKIPTTTQQTHTFTIHFVLPISPCMGKTITIVLLT